MEIACKWKETATRQNGHFVIYTVDGGRFMILLAYLNYPIFRELLLMVEEKFGFTGCGPLQCPMKPLKNASKELEKALVSMASCRASLPSPCLHQTTPANMIRNMF
ncbi:hypothetical protein AMTRI_Chr09g14580 [Amborella trichopoda]